MFERATKKLGLDQAVFYGDNFKGNSQTRKVDGEVKKMDKEQIENLLKKGILGLIDEETNLSKTFHENDIDQILLNSTRQANYSQVFGTYTVQKHNFVAENTDANIKMDDPEFWKKILKAEDSKTYKLY